MAYFARKLRYGACDGDSGASFYFALVELARKKGGRSIGFVLYRRIMFCVKNRTDMIRLSANTAEEAVRRFWPSNTKGIGSEFPGHRSEQWEKTTLWLDSVVDGGAHERFGPGWWVKVGTPAKRRKKKKKPLQVGNISHILVKHQARLNNLLDERSCLRYKLSSLESFDEESESGYVAEEDTEEHDLALEAMEKIDDEIDLAHEDIARTKAEMQYMTRKIFPKPVGLVPWRVLRYERERKDMKLSGW